MRRRGPRPVALDHNFPKTILQPIARFVGEVSLHWIADIGEELPDLDDDALIYELHRRGISVLLTSDHHMVRNVGVLVAIEQTRMSVLTGEGIGDDPLFATGVLLRDLIPLLKSDYPRGLVYVAHPARVRGTRSRDLLARTIDDDSDVTPEDLVSEYGLPYAERNYYPEEDPRVVR